MMRGNGLVKVSYSFFSGSRLDGTVVVVTVVVVVVLVPPPPTVVVVVRGLDLGIQIRFLPTRMQMCAAPPIVRTAPIREHAPDAACIGAEGENTVSKTTAASAATRCRWLLLLVRLESTEYLPFTSSPT
jgi:hypothetical protein